MVISTIIPIYNAELFIEKAVLSAIQFSEVKEILLIDDASTDGSANICKELADKHEIVKFLQHSDKKNHGVSATRNLGINLASQEFITFLDADDYWLPNRFDAEREIFKNEKIDGVFGAIGVEFVTDAGKEKYLSVINDTGLTTVYYEAEGIDVFLGLIQINPNFGTFFSLIATTIKKAAIEHPKLRLNEDLRMHEDKEFIVKLAYHCNLKTGLIDEAVAIRTGHENNTFSSVQNYTKAFYKNQEKLYKSLWNWAKKENKMRPDAIQLFKLKYLSCKILSLSGISRYLYYARYVVINPTLLKTRYRYPILKIHHHK